MFGDDKNRDYRCAKLYFEILRRVHDGTLTEKDWDSFYERHCRGCYHASEICMYGEEGCIPPLSIKRALNENTHKKSVLVGGVEYAVHFTKNREALVTDRDDYSKVYAIMPLGFYKRLEEREDVS